MATGLITMLVKGNVYTEVEVDRKEITLAVLKQLIHKIVYNGNKYDWFEEQEDGSYMGYWIDGYGRYETTHNEYFFYNEGYCVEDLKSVLNTADMVKSLFSVK